MKWDSIKIDEVCLQSRVRDPRINPKEPFLYIDLSSIDRSQKIIKSTHKLIGSEAPNQARNEIREGDILVSTVRPNQNSVAIVPQNLDGQIASTQFCVLRPNTSVIERKFLFYYTTTQEFVRILAGKSRRSSFSTTDVNEMELPLPGLSEQARIVKIIDQAELLRVKCTEAIENAARILPVLFYNNFGDPATNPKRWPTKLLGEVTVGSPQYGPNSSPIDWTHGAPRLIRIIDITDDGYLKKTRFVTLDWDNWTQFQLSPGDLLFSGSGTKGKTYWYRSQDGLCVYDNYFVRFKIDQSHVLAGYLFALTQTEYYKNWVEARKTVSPLPKIMSQEIASLPVPCPPIPLQEHFAKKLEVFACVRKNQIDLKNRIMQLYNLLLRNAFSGELTAKWRDIHIKELDFEIQEQKKAIENQSTSTKFSSSV